MSQPGIVVDMAAVQEEERITTKTIDFIFNAELNAFDELLVNGGDPNTHLMHGIYLIGRQVAPNNALFNLPWEKFVETKKRELNVT